MSRAFVKDQDDAPEPLPERPVSAGPNYVTARGLALIDAAIAALRKQLAEAQAAEDQEHIARANRDLRYWTQRRASAQLVEPPARPDSVVFGTRVTIERSDGRRQSFAIVGEDEADPAQGTIAYSAPLARSLMGKVVGDVAQVPGGEAEIVSID